jgi:hypothetical protein
MRRQAVLALGLALLACACAPKIKCPTPVAYDDATVKKSQKAREELPKDSILHQVLIDYENERDDMRYCLSR